MIVVKVGGAEGIDTQALCRDVAGLVQNGRSLVLVHGGSHDTNELSVRLGYPPRFVTSPSGQQSRYTDRQTLEIFAMVVAGKVNKHLVEGLQGMRVNAIGLSGVDGRLMLGRRKSTLKIVEGGKTLLLRDEWSGVVEQVNVPLLVWLLEQGYTPVIAPLAVSYQGEMLNVDGDRAAAALACALSAEALVLLTNVPGLLARFPEDSSLIPHVGRDELEACAACARGRMKKKVLGAGEALEGGVGRVVIADGRVPAPVTRALAGRGTVID